MGGPESGTVRGAVLIGAGSAERPRELGNRQLVSKCSNPFTPETKIFDWHFLSHWSQRTLTSTMTITPHHQPLQVISMTPMVAT